METDIHDLRSSVSEVKDSVAALDSRMENRLGELNVRIEKGFADVCSRMDEGFAAIDVRMEKVESGRAKDRVWWLLIAATLLGVMARGFKWI